jgi:4-hydroxythreonine-4-phosphate dehydrogenase
MSLPAKPLLAITMGDPAGIGPEVILRAWATEAVHACSRPIVLGHAEILRRAARLVVADCEVVEMSSLASLGNLAVGPNRIPCLQCVADDAASVPAGNVDPRGGEAAFQAVRMATKLALDRQLDAIVTAPLSKAALHAAGHYYPGHTELLAEMCGVRDFAMMLYLSGERGAGSGGRGAGNSGVEQQSSRAVAHPLLHSSTSPLPLGLGVVHVTLHQSLRSVFDNLTTEAILTKCRLADGVMRRLGVAEPRLAVCALNPHAGEDGLFGNEEQTVIAPAVEIARREGFNTSGPYPTDTLMVRAAGGEFDVVVAMYHDQGHIALKLLGMHAAVNITLGLPIVRTSVAHGTAFDRAWQGTARAEGMVAAIRTAARLADSR